MEEKCFICGAKLLNGKECEECGYVAFVEDLCPRLAQDKKTCIHTNDFCLQPAEYVGCPIVLRNN